MGLSKICVVKYLLLEFLDKTLRVTYHKSGKAGRQGAWGWLQFL
jgi:hypothetical protein